MLNLPTQRDLGPNSAHTNDPHGGWGLLDTLRGITDSNLEYACDCLGIDPSRLGRERMMKEIVKTLTSHKLRKVLKTLTPKSLECLSYIALDKGGYVTNSELSKRFGRELNNMIDELYGVCLVVMMATDRNATRPHSVGIAPDLLVAMYRFKCLGLKRWHPKP